MRSELRGVNIRSGFFLILAHSSLKDNFCDSQFECRSAGFNDNNSLGRRCTVTWATSCAVSVEKDLLRCLWHGYLTLPCPTQDGLVCDEATETCITKSLGIGEKCDKSELCGVSRPQAPALNFLSTDVPETSSE